MLLVVGRILNAGAWLVRAVACDGHNSHRYFKEALHGSFCKLDPSILQELPFWKDVQYQALPKHCLPRLPLRICKYQNEPIWLIGGPCPLVNLQSFVIVLLGVFQCFWNVCMAHGFTMVHNVTPCYTIKWQIFWLLHDSHRFTMFIFVILCYFCLIPYYINLYHTILLISYNFLYIPFVSLCFILF